MLKIGTWTAALVLLVAGVAATSSGVEAKGIKLRYGPALYSKHYSYDVITKTPQHGYEGNPVPGSNIFCSYRRNPIRKCSVGQAGQQLCRTVAWRLHQFCTNS